MATGTVVSRILGFARAILLAAAIGVTTDAADAFGVANQLPNNVYAIIVGGLLNAVLVPQLVRARSGADDGRGYIDRFVTLAITVFFAVSLVFTLAAPLLVRLYTSGWSESQLALATAFAYWCLPQLFFYGLYSILGEVLNSRKAFGPFMWAPVLNNVVAIAGLLAFILFFGADPTGNRAASDWGPDQISLLAGTATLGVAAQALILLVAWRRIGLHLRLNFKWRGFGLGPALRMASWSLGMVLVTQVGGLVQTVVTSTAVGARTEGVAIASVAAFAIAWLIFMLPHSVVTVSISTAYFTRMSEHAQAGRIDALKADLTSGLRIIALVSVVSTAVIAICAYPIARVFVGEYPATVALGNVIFAIMFGLVPFSWVYLLQRAFFSLEDTRTPFFFTSVQVALHIVGSISLGFLLPPQWLVVGIAALTGFTIVIQGLLAHALLKRQIGKPTESGVGIALAKFFLAGLVSAALGYLALAYLGGVGEGAFPVDRVITSIISATLVGLVMLASYLGLLWLLRVPELRELTPLVRRLFTRQ